MSAQTTSSRLRLLFLAAGSTLVLASGAHASGFGVYEISVEGLGRANAGEVSDSGAGALWWNPAAIARSQNEVSLGLLRRDHSTDFTDEGSTITRPIPPAGLTTPVGGRSQVSDASEDFTTYSAGGALRLGERAAIGLSVTKPFHVETTFGDDSWTRYDTIRNKIEATNFQLTGALRANDWLDLGVGVSAQKVEAFLDSASPNLDPSLADGLQHLDAEGWAYGWTAGAQAHLSDITFGVSYRSAIEHEMDGELTLTGLVGPLASANFAAPSTTTFTLPWSLTVGARWAATPDLTVSTQVVRTGWSKYDKIDVAFAGQSSSIDQLFQDTTSIAFGVDYQLDATWTVRGGVQFDPTPTRNTLRESGVFDGDRRLYAVGASAKLAEGMTLHGALAYTDFSSAEIVDTNGFYAGTPAFTVSPHRGRFDGHGLTAALGVDWSF